MWSDLDLSNFKVEMNPLGTFKLKEFKMFKSDSHII